MKNRPLATVNLNNQAHRNDKRIEDAPRQPRDQVITKNKGMEIVAAVEEQPKTAVREVEADLGLNHVSATTVKHRVYKGGLRSRMAARKPLMRAENNAKRLQFVELNNTPTAKAHTKDVEGLRDTIVKRVDEFLQFHQAQSADLLRRTQKLSQDGPPDSGERPSGEQGACCGEGTLPAVESYQDLAEYVRSLGAPSKSKLNLAAADDAEETLLPWSTDFDSLDDLEETLEPGMAAGGKNELDETLIALENAVNQFHRDFQEYRKVFRKIKKGGDMKIGKSRGTVHQNERS
ncbi:hypothetical protein MRX96_000528 [Rhipicephalus microplus]